CAVVAEVSVNTDTGVITVTKVTAGLGPRAPVNTTCLANPTEGQAKHRIMRTPVEAVTFHPGSQTTTTTGWLTEPVFTVGDALLVIDTVLINNLNVPPTGAGETTITVVAAAIGNAVYDATGIRMRQVPFTPDRFVSARTAQKG